MKSIASTSISRHLDRVLTSDRIGIDNLVYPPHRLHRPPALNYIPPAGYWTPYKLPSVRNVDTIYDAYPQLSQK
jgi:hypothetical protein